MHTKQANSTEVTGVGRVWVVTASCVGPGLASMQTGDVFQLKLAQFDHKLFVSSYQRAP